MHLLTTTVTQHTQIQIKVERSKQLRSAGRRCEVQWFMIKRGFIVMAVSELDFHHENCKFTK